MYKKTYIIIVVCIVNIALLNSFTYLTKQVSITQQDIKLRIPKGFPAPVYSFKENILKAETFVLGRQLFYDPLLSKDHTISCATCHQGFAAFAHVDHALSHGIDGKIGTRNVPALQNLIWKDAFMWDGSITQFEQQPINPITHPAEMGETMEHVIQKIQQEDHYRKLFQQAFGDTLVTEKRLLKALAQFTGLMISANAKYDQYLAGKANLTLAEKNGLVLFRKNCAGCHREPLFTDNSYRNNGLQPDSNLNDQGRFSVTHQAKEAYAFKVPSLRNVAVTFPYMHDGRFMRLREVLDHYTSTQTIAANADEQIKKIQPLSENEKKDIIAFLLTLTDTDFIQDKRFTDPAAR